MSSADRKLHVVLTGGGSGGHTTPLIAVAEQLERYKRVQVSVISEAKAEESAPIGDYDTYYVWAGKFRRYHGFTLWQKIKTSKNILLNIRDVCKLVVGYVQSLKLLHQLRPDVIFVKGGYVSLPVGFAAWTLGIPYITHDSDVLPGLTNRLLARGAAKNLTGFPKENYSYSLSKVEHVGVPIRAEFSSLTRSAARKKLKLSPKTPLVVITGGSNGGRKINYSVMKVINQLSKMAYVVHQAGGADIDDLTSIMKAKRVPAKTYKLVDYIEGSVMAHYLAAADVIVARAGATTLSELAELQKATIVIANPRLTGGHQLKNADVLVNHDAARVLHEAELVHDPNMLLVYIDELLRSKQEREWLGNNLQKVFKPDAARVIAKTLVSIGGQNAIKKS